MPNTVRVTVDGVDDLLNAGMYDAGAIIRLQSCATETGVYANVTTAALVSGTRIYPMYDTAGASSTWYRTRYENAGGTVTSTWSDVFQAGGEEGGLICSLYDVKQQLGIPDATTTSDEELTEFIRAVTDDFEFLTGRDFTGAQGDVTFRVHTRSGRVLWIPRGIQSVTTLGIATDDQPSSGGTYATATATDYFLDPPEYERGPYWPATRIVFRSQAGTRFYDAAYGAEITGRPGWAQVPPNIARIGASAVCARFLTKGREGPRAVIGPDGRATILRDVSPADFATLMRYAVLQ